MKMRLIFLFVALIVAIGADSAFGVYYWDPDGSRAPLVGLWCDVNNWSSTNSTTPTGGNAPQFTPPLGDQEVAAYGNPDIPGAKIIVRRMNVFTTLMSNRCRFFGGIAVDIEDGGLIGMGWLRVGEKSQPNPVGYKTIVNQSGGRVEFVNGGKDAARLTISDGGGGGADADGYWNISGGTLTYDKASTTSGNLTIGDRQGNGTLRVIGTGGTVDMGPLEMGGRIGSTNRASDGTLAFEIEHDGVSAVQCTSAAKYDGSTTHLVITLTEALDNPDELIVLVRNTGTDATPILFDDCNGRSAGEHAVVNFGGVYRILTYRYDADGDGANNDIALVPEPATLALLGLGMFIIKRRK